MNRATKLALLALILVPVARSQTPPERRVVITIDDLPAAAANFMTGEGISLPHPRKRIEGGPMHPEDPFGASSRS